jgi:hypothetical protein
VANDELTGAVPSLGSNGDGVYLYDAAGNPITNSLYTAATAGYSVEFDTTGAVIGDAVDGVNGAYTSLEGDVASPANMVPNTFIGENEIISNIYPNPSNGTFTVAFGQKMEYSVEVFALTGERVYGAKGAAVEARIKLDVANGSYLVKVSTELGTANQLIIVQ